MAKYEVTPLPDLDTTEMLDGDELHIKYDLFQGGSWVVGYQVGKLEQNLEEDGRFTLVSYHYDEEAMTVDFVLIRNPNPSVKVQLAGGFAIKAAIVLVMAGISWIAYDRTREVKYYREAVNDPSIPQEVRDKINQAVQTAEESNGGMLGGLTGAAKDLAAAAVLIGLALLALAVLGD